MPKSKKKPAPTRKKQKSYDYPGGDVVQAAYRHPKVSLIVTILVVGLLGWWGVRAVATELQFRQDKKQYAATEASMAKVYDQMIAVAGAPAESHVRKSCDHRSAKFEAGDLYCEIVYEFFYPAPNSERGVSLVNYFMGPLGQMTKNQQVPNVSRNESEKSQSYPFEYEKSMGCGLVYELKDADTHNIALGDGSQDDEFKVATQEPYAAEFSFYCDSFPAKPVYELER